MEALKKEIEARKNRTNELKERSTGAKRKFIRRGELAAVEQQEIEQKRATFELELERRKNQARDDSRGGAELNEILTKRHKFTNDGKIDRSTSETNDENIHDESKIPLSCDEVKQRLRAMGVPVTYFGESDLDRYNRMRKIEEEGVDDDFAISGGFNTRNVFLDQDNRNGTNNDDDDDDDDDDDTPKASKTKNYRDEFMNDAFDQKRDAMPPPGSTAKEGASGGAATEQNQEPHRLVKDYFRMLIRDWEETLNARPDHVKRTAQGKIETKTQKQCKDYIRPLFKLCKRREIPEDILQNLVLITKYCREGEFVKANDAYIVTAIGKAAWPIGVTSVGIHNRSAHDKMQTGQVAHVMNNEMQRKYLQSVKRLIKFEQTRRVDVPPSKKVL